MSSYWGHFSEPGYLRPSARCASPAPQAPSLQTVALKAGSGNRSGKVRATAPSRLLACALVSLRWPPLTDAGRRAMMQPFSPLTGCTSVRATRMLQPGVHRQTNTLPVKWAAGCAVTAALPLSEPPLTYQCLSSF